MSLLMKALEKAAKDRGAAQTEAASKTVAAAASLAPIASSSSSASELSLEPLAAETPSFQHRLEPVQKSAPPPAPPPTVSAAASARTQDGQIKAATVMQAASKRSADGLGIYIRSHPVVALGSAAGLFLAGFAIYVYLQIFNPGLLVRQPPPALKPPLTQAPAPPAPPIATSSLIQRAPESEPPGATPRPQARPAVPAALLPPAAAETPRNTITVSRTNTTATVTPLLAEAYAALEANALDAAQRLYNQLLRNEPKNIDALLGLAAIATQEGKTDEATRHYLQILELDPRHALAQSGLISLLGRADPLAAESRLKQLISREPSPFLYFTLGNLYADQSLWAQAQQAYFQAHQLDPANADYTYNLAVGLEHLSQPKLALGYYRRAMQLASTKGRANFSLTQAQERIAKLASRVE